MNTEDYDLECTCDVGPFSTCLVHERLTSQSVKVGRTKTKTKLDNRLDMNLDSYLFYRGLK